jgi:hypothetical protein
MKAWLVTWEWGVDDFHKYTDTDRVAAIINPRRSGESVRQLVELLYVSKFYTLSQRMDWARAGNSDLARFGSLNGTRWDGQIFCGHNPPTLYARRVDDFRIERDAGGEKAVWTETATLNIIHPTQSDSRRGTSRQPGIRIK